MLALLPQHSLILLNPQGDMMIREEDKLLIVGPNAKFTDLEGKA